MRKSPLSMPGGSRSQHNHEWKSYVDTKRTNCGLVAYKRGCYSYNGGELNRGDDDFIPLNSSTPDQRKHSGNRYDSGVGRNHRNSGSSLFNHNRGNHFANTKPHFNNSYSPYKHTGIQIHGHNKSMQKDGHRQVDISRYVDIKSVLEDPWAELMQKLDDSRIENKMDILNGCSSFPDFKENRESVPSIDKHYQNIQDNRQPKLLDFDLEISNNAPKCEAENSLCIEHEDIKFDTPSNNESLCNVSNTDCRSAKKNSKNDT